MSLPKRQKQLLSRSIVHAVRSQNPPGRFLQRSAATDLWYDVGDARATEKTSQALREGAPKLRDKIKHGDEETVDADDGVVAPPSSSVPPVTPQPPPPDATRSAPPKQARAQAQTREPAHPTPAQRQPPPRNEEPYPYYHHPNHPNAQVMPPPPTHLEGDFSFGTMSVPEAPDLGLEHGFSFGSSVMSVVDPQQHRQRQNSLRHSGGSMVPMPTGLQGQELSFGSMIMTEAEQRKLEQNIRDEQQNQHHFPARIDERHEEVAPLPVDYGLEAGNSALSMMSFGTIQTIPGTEHDHHSHHDQNNKPGVVSFGSVANEQIRYDNGHGSQEYNEHVPEPVDYGLEVGNSALSMMSIGTIKLDDGGTSFGSAMSFATHRPPGAVEGGLQDIGTSFGSMTIGGLAPPPTAAGKDAFEPPEPSAEPTFLHQQRSKANLLACDDSDSEDEQHSAQASLQKSADWAKLQATFEAQMQSGNMANSAAMPPSLYGMNGGRGGDSTPVVLPTAVGSAATKDSLGNMPPPASRKEDHDAWHAYEATLLNRGDSLADEDFNASPKEADD